MNTTTLSKILNRARCAIHGAAPEMGFDGIVIEGFLGRGLSGEVYDSDRYQNGTPIITSEVVKIGYLGECVYALTVNGSRYLIGNLIDDALAHHLKYIAINQQYFAPLAYHAEEVSTLRHALTLHAGYEAQNLGHALYGQPEAESIQSA